MRHEELTEIRDRLGELAERLDRLADGERRRVEGIRATHRAKNALYRQASRDGIAEREGAADGAA